MTMIGFSLLLAVCLASKSVTIADELRFLSSDTETLAQKAWTSFKAEHGKAYASVDEEYRRMQIFYENLKTIESHNYLYKMGNETYEMGINSLSDMELSEIINQNCFEEINMTNSNELESSPLLNDSSSPLLNDSAILPRAIDWRKKNYVTRVKNQKHCGSCWAFSATGSLEGQTKRKTGRLISLSEQNLVDCSRPQGNRGCKGGLMNKAFEYIRVNGGIDTEASYPYEAKEGICRYNARAKGATVKRFVTLARGKERALTKAIARIGPISVAISAQPSFRHYKRGIYEDSSCKGQKLNHGVLIVGYGAVKRKQFYIVKNSWGPQWGENGYIRMARNKKNMCGIATLASYPVV